MTSIVTDHSAFTKLVEDVLKQTAEEEIKNAVEQYEKAVRQRLANTAMNAANFYHIDRSGPELRITVVIK